MNFTYGLVCFAVLAGWLDFRGPRRLEAGEVVLGDFIFLVVQFLLSNSPKGQTAYTEFFVPVIISLNLTLCI